MTFPHLYANLDAAYAQIDAAAVTMWLTPTEEAIVAYEQALDVASMARKAIGDASDADMHQRSIDASMLANRITLRGFGLTQNGAKS
jgi:hypothetical protein